MTSHIGDVVIREFIVVKYRSFIQFVILNCCLVLFANYSNAELVFSAPPRESAQAGTDLYGPLVDHLSELLGERVSYRHPKNWLQYQRDLRKGTYDIVFDGPHFVSWRMAHLDHEVLVKLPGKLEFIIVSRTDDDSVKKVNDLIGQKICAIPPPNLATLRMIGLFSNPARQPVIWGVSGGYKKVFAAFNRGECSAAVFRTSYYKKTLTEFDRTNKKILYKSKSLPNQAISVGRNISKSNRVKMIRSLTLGRGKAALAPITKRFGDEKARPFVAAKNKEYRNHLDLLEGVVFGW